MTYGPQGEPIRVAETAEEKRESRVQEPVTLGTGAEAPLPIHEPSIPPMQRAGARPTNPPEPGRGQSAPLASDERPEPRELSDAEREAEAQAMEADVIAANEEMGERLAAAKRLVRQWQDTAETTPIRSERNRGQREMLLNCADELRTALGI